MDKILLKISLKTKALIKPRFSEKNEEYYHHLSLLREILLKMMCKFQNVAGYVDKLKGRF